MIDDASSNVDGGGNNLSDKPKQVRPRISSKKRAAKAKGISEHAIEIVWDYWVQTMKSSRAILDHERSVVIGAAIYDYGIQLCCDAIDGCARSSFHMGHNKQQKKYNSIDLIFRNSEKIESFIARSQKRDPRQEFLNE